MDVMSLRDSSSVLLIRDVLLMIFNFKLYLTVSVALGNFISFFIKNFAFVNEAKLGGASEEKQTRLFILLSACTNIAFVIETKLHKDMNNNIALKSNFGTMTDCTSSSKASFTERISYSFSALMGSAAELMNSAASLMGSAAELMSLTADRLSNYYSTVLEEPVDRKRTFRLLHAQIAFLAMLLLAGAGFIGAAVGVAWFAFAAKRC